MFRQQVVLDELEAGGLGVFDDAGGEGFGESVVGGNHGESLGLGGEGLEEGSGGLELAGGAGEHAEDVAVALGEDLVGAAAGLDHRALGALGDGGSGQDDVAAEGAEEEIDAVVEQALDQGGGARGV